MSKDRDRKKVGRLGEEIAVNFLRSKGFTIIERNYRRPWGEIDIIAEKDNSVRFVEVKTVSRERFLDYAPEEQVHERKLERIARTAELYMANNNDDRDFQIDVVGIYLDRTAKRANCSLTEQVL